MVTSNLAKYQINTNKIAKDFKFCTNQVTLLIKHTSINQFKRGPMRLLGVTCPTSFSITLQTSKADVN